MSSVSKGDEVLIVTPLVFSWLTTYLTGKVESKEKYKKAWFQPPGWVFFVVWTLLYIMFGFLLFESKRQEDYFTMGLVIAIICLTYLWQYLFSYLRNYKLAFYDLILILLIGVFLYTRLNFSPVVDNTTFGRGYVYIYIPFVVWMVLAILLSVESKYYKIKKQ